jgi:hypothetical protein
VVTAGFGKEMYLDKEGVKCWTNEEEPNPFSPCKQTFKYRGEKVKVMALIIYTLKKAPRHSA